MEMYTEAIFCKVPADKKAVYYCNRALVHIKAENHSFALFDACESIKLHKDYVKAYYRRAQAYVLLKQFENAVLDFKMVCKLQPDNQEAKAKLADTEKMQMLSKLQQSALYEEAKITVNPGSIKVDKEYSGPRLQDIDDITPEWVLSLIKWQKDQKLIHKKFATMIINKATELFEQEKNCVNI